MARPPQMCQFSTCWICNLWHKFRILLCNCELMKYLHMDFPTKFLFKHLKVCTAHTHIRMGVCLYVKSLFLWSKYTQYQHHWWWWWWWWESYFFFHFDSVVLVCMLCKVHTSKRMFCFLCVKIFSRDFGKANTHSRYSFCVNVRFEKKHNTHRRWHENVWMLLLLLFGLRFSHLCVLCSVNTTPKPYCEWSKRNEESNSILLDERLWHTTTMHTAIVWWSKFFPGKSFFNHSLTQANENVCILLS